jgi:uncharacterized protein (UPF0276 family)
MAPQTLRRGHGFGLRAPHTAELLAGGVAGVDFVEAISENLLGRGGRPRALLERVRRDVPVALHGVSMSVGGADPLDEAYLRALRTLCDEIEPALVSDHLCFGSVGGRYGHDLWPLPFTEEVVAHVAARAGRVQEVLGRQLLLENVSSYVGFSASTLTEWDALAEVARRSGCGILLDVNNVYVSAHNHGFSAEGYIDALPRDRVQQIHLAGHAARGPLLLDNHGSAVPAPVWDLYARAVSRLGAVPTIVEWDEDVPSLDRLREEALSARAVEARVLARAAAATALGPPSGRRHPLPPAEVPL